MTASTRRARRKEQIIYAKDLLKKRHGRSGPGSRSSPGQSSSPNATQSSHCRIKPKSTSPQSKVYGSSSCSTDGRNRSYQVVGQVKPVTRHVIPCPSNDSPQCSRRDDSPHLKSLMSKGKYRHSWLYDSPADSTNSTSDKSSSVRSSYSKKGSQNRNQRRKKLKERYLKHRQPSSSNTFDQRDLCSSNSRSASSSFSSVENRHHVKSLRLDDYEKRYYQDKRLRKQQGHRQGSADVSHRSISTGDSSWSSNSTDPTCDTTPERSRDIRGCGSSSDSRSSQRSRSKPNKLSLQVSRRTRVHCDAVPANREYVEDDSTCLNTSNETELDDVFVVGHQEEREEPSSTFRERILTTLDSFLCHSSSVDETREYSASFDEDGVVSNDERGNNRMMSIKNAMSCCSNRQDVESTASLEVDFVSPQVIRELPVSTSYEISREHREFFFYADSASSQKEVKLASAPSDRDPQDSVERHNDAATAVTARDFAVEVCCSDVDQGVELVAQDFDATFSANEFDNASNVAEMSDVPDPLDVSSNSESNALDTENEEPEDLEDKVPRR